MRNWRRYSDATFLPQHGYFRNKFVLSSSGDPAQVVMPAVLRVAALLKRWLGTHQGAVHAAHLDYYLDEFTFRFTPDIPQSWEAFLPITAEYRHDRAGLLPTDR